MDARVTQLDATHCSYVDQVVAIACTILWAEINDKIVMVMPEL